MAEPVATSITRHFASLPDPRVARTKDPLLLDILTIALCAVLCGAANWVAVATVGRAKEPWLRTFPALPRGIPSHDPCGRVFARLDPGAFGRRFLAWAQAVAPGCAAPAAPRLRAVDGQTLRGARDGAAGRAALHLVRAWAAECRLVLGQLAVDGKSNEITAIPALLALRDLAGGTVTIDAMGGQTAIAQQVAAQGGDDVLALKEHRPTLHADVRQAFAEARADGFAAFAPAHRDYARTVDKGHGRLEIRRHWPWHDPELIAYLDPAGAWANLRGVGLVEAERHLGEAVAIEQRDYLLSAPLAAAAFGRAVRAHWGSEHQVHWVLDGTFGADAGRVRAGRGAQNFALLRQVARNLLRQEPTHRGSLPAKRCTAALDDTYRAALLAPLLADLATVRQ
ncbi:MAG TPA: ISAs1 family transposase [Thermomicrobiales bacterium]|nr:ISAs1 family transposase [Thermomicrobiales bacterium]